MEQKKIDSTKLPEQFNEFADARKNGFLKAMQLKQNGGRIAGIFCTFTPLEIIDAADLIPVSLCGASNETVPISETVLPKDICPLIKSSYGFAISDKCPYTHFADLIIGETTCDGKKKMYELLSRIKDVHILHLPQGINRPYALEMWKSEIRELIKVLENKFNIKITDEKIREAVKLRNEERKIKTELFELNKLTPPSCYTTDIYKVVDSLNFTFDRKKSIEDIKKLIEDIKENYKNEANRIDVNKKRILITGCPLSGVFDKTIKYIEDNGAVVVGMDSCSGIKTNTELIDENANDIIEAIAKKYLNIGCAVMSPDTNRFKQLNTLIEDYKADGVVEIILQNCQTFETESIQIKENCKKINKPYLNIYTDFSNTDSGQLKTRLDAFIEMIS